VEEKLAESKGESQTYMAKNVEIAKG